MDFPESVLTDIKDLHNQLRLAIQEHQVTASKLRTDPLNMQIQNQLIDVQSHIMFLGDSQKQLVQRLREESEANSTKSKIARTQIGNSFGHMGCSRTISLNNNNSSNSPKSEPILKDRDSPQSFGESRIITSRSTSAPPTSSIGSDDSEPQRKDIVISVSLTSNESMQDSNSAPKLQFMKALGLVTREMLSELQNRRVKRKRRSTANHTEFVYGSSWDVSKRKKNNYLMSGSSPMATHNLTRSLRSVSTELEQEKIQQHTPSSSPPALPSPAPNRICQAAVLEGVNNPTSTVQARLAVTESNRQPLQPTTSQTTVSSLCCASGALSPRISGLPSSLTVEKIAAHEHICVVCRKIGSLSTCSSCNAEYHLACGGYESKCPQCTVKQEGEPPENSSASSFLQSRNCSLQPYVTENNPDIKGSLSTCSSCNAEYHLACGGYESKCPQCTVKQEGEPPENSSASSFLQSRNCSLQPYVTENNPDIKGSLSTCSSCNAEYHLACGGYESKCPQCTVKQEGEPPENSSASSFLQSRNCSLQPYVTENNPDIKGSLSTCSSCKAEYHLACGGYESKCPQCTVKQEGEPPENSSASSFLQSMNCSLQPYVTENNPDIKGSLSTCSSCNAEYHLACGGYESKCPQCTVKQEGEPPENSSASSFLQSRNCSLQPYVTANNPDIKGSLSTCSSCNAEYHLACGGYESKCPQCTVKQEGEPPENSSASSFLQSRNCSLQPYVTENNPDVKGSLSTCSSCNVEYHLACGGYESKCPQCTVKQEGEPPENSSASSFLQSRNCSLQPYVTENNPDIKGSLSTCSSCNAEYHLACGGYESKCPQCPVKQEGEPPENSSASSFLQSRNCSLQPYVTENNPDIKGPSYCQKGASTD